MKNYQYIFLFILSLIISSHAAIAYNLRQFSSKNGLSNSAVTSIYQQRNGLLWLGTCDGLNFFDGVNLKTYHPLNENNNLSGNLIEGILEAEDNILWIYTNYGLNRLDLKRNTIEYFDEFRHANKIAKSPNNDIYVSQENNFIYHYHSDFGEFRKVHLPGVQLETIVELAVDSKNTLWVFTSDGQCHNFSIIQTDGNTTLSSSDNFRRPQHIRWCSVEEDVLYYVDDSYAFYEYDLLTKQENQIYDLYFEVSHKGEISAIIKQDHDYYIAFKRSGLISLMHQPTQKIKYEVADIAIKSGIFCLAKDRFQDIIWVGTDGQGVFMHFNDSHSIASIPSGSLSVPVNNPIRALFLDKEYTLWIGTKGDGIVCLENFNPVNNTYTLIKQLMTGNSSLLDNSVYCFTRSKKNILWVGNENGINYYSYREKKLKPVSLIANDGKPVRYVHSICELNDSTLWIATVGEGIIKAHLGGGADSPVLTSVKRITIDEGKPSSNYFFQVYKENDSILWFANRGLGAYRMNVETEVKQVFRFDEGSNNKTLNDVFVIHRNVEGHWFGTSYGVSYLSNGKKQLFNTNNSLSNNTIHGILEDDRHNLWFSTNRGMVKFNINDNTVHTYKHNNELMVTEFSDGAYFKDERTGTLFFGGIDGFITIQDNAVSPKEYTPPMQFVNFSIYGKEYNIFDFLHTDNKTETLTLNHNQNFFSLAFTALDYTNGNNYTYYYKIDGANNDWVVNGNSSTATFTSIAPGTYSLLVKYRNNTTGIESKIQSLKIIILPPWYQTHLAYFCYALLLLAFLLFCIRLSISWYRIKRDKMIEEINRRQREEVYESKLRIFTNITHEFCTPLTLIYGPCEKIISYQKSDSHIKKYATLIQRNAERLNALIQELIEFRRLETGHKKIQIKNIFATELVSSVATSFCELAESRNIDYQIKLRDEIQWNSDAHSINTIATNLISNAFKYTPDFGTVSVELFLENGQLHLIVSNSGKGIKEEDLNKVFDRYTILDSFEMPGKNNFSFRNGLGLSICYNLVQLLEGDIRISSIPNEITTFEVVLPVLSITSPDMEENTIGPVVPIPVNAEKTLPALENTPLEYDKEKPTIMLIDDDPAILWFVTEIFRNTYNVIPLNDPKEVMDRLKVNLPDLIISDVMMPGIDGILLTKTLKSNKLFSHIPLILLSARNDIEEQVKGIESGAEIYITKPFNVKYLERIVARLLQREEELKDYYGSVYSSFQLDGGHFVHKEDKEFFDEMMKAIDSNIADPNLSIEVLSTLLGCGIRQFYRKLKRITEKTPAEVIKEYRLSVVEKLLVTTNLSIDEIAFKVGFTNRGNFYKIFAQKFGTTPKKYRSEKQLEFKRESEVEEEVK